MASYVAMLVFVRAVTMSSLGLLCSLGLWDPCSKSFSEGQWESLTSMILWTQSLHTASVDFGVWSLLASLTMTKASSSQVLDKFSESNWSEPGHCFRSPSSCLSHSSIHWRRWGESAYRRSKRSSEWTSIWNRIFLNQTIKKKIEYQPMYFNR